VRDQILVDARAMLDEPLHDIADYVVGAIDDRGYLSSTAEQIARNLGRPLAEVQRTIVAVQEVGPPGVGARSIEECLLLQIRQIKQNGGKVPRFVTEIVSSYLSELGGHRYHNLARQLHCSVEEIADAHEFIRCHLNPQPLQCAQVHQWRQPAEIPLVAPDVIISLLEDEILIEVVGGDQDRLTINRTYEDLAAAFQSGPHKKNGTSPSPPDGISPEDKAHVTESVSNARRFITKLQQRRDTLLRITTCIAERQSDFLRGGVRDLRPLTRSEVAQRVGVHESTVSRATANKYAMLPNRRVVPFSDFFTPSLSAKDAIREIIEFERHNGESLSDMKVCELLSERGYRIARRTVAKYRSEMRILPSTIR
jgi:RNA polymerase sigma-54 factor